ncbi:MAG: UDPGP type 1 family protein [Phycisphaerales bacterium]|nr:UDPGP type 1 family protein [Phycisphaerales bacterium]
MTTSPPEAELRQRLDRTVEMLEGHGQAHLLARSGELEPEALESLLDQIDGIDIPSSVRLMNEARSGGCATPPEDSIRPAKVVPHEPADAESMRARGQQLVDEGRVAAFTVAGGQGTRLGWNGPKGTYPASPITGKPLFRLFAEQLLAHARRSGRSIPWYIMTSPINDADTRAFFQDNNWFGLDRTDVFLFPQGVLPSYDDDGRFLLSEPGKIAVNPDGHGGALRALRGSGAIEDMLARGIEHISYFQVDNPTVQVIDPLFLGLHASSEESSGEISSKMVPKAAPDEKVGVFCEVDGRTCVIEYSDLPEELATAREPDGSLRFLAGSIAIHALSVDFIARLTSEDSELALPLHQARKKVPYVETSDGGRIEPTSPNATKLELFIFDAVPLASRSLVWETDRVEEFAPIKNAEGSDSAVTSRDLQFERAARWLEANGHDMPRDADGTPLALVEITSETALDRRDLAGADLPDAFKPGEQYIL